MMMNLCSRVYFDSNDGIVYRARFNRRIMGLANVMDVDVDIQTHLVRNKFYALM